MPTEPEDITPIRRAVAAHWTALVDAAGGAAEVSRRLGVSKQRVYELASGRRFLAIERWPAFASAVGVRTCEGLFPPGILDPEKYPEK